jgi:hypothetical protein
VARGPEDGSSFVFRNVVEHIFIYSVGDRIINECAGVDGTITGRGSKVLGENLPACHFVHLKLDVAKPAIEPRP